MERSTADSAETKPDIDQLSKSGKHKNVRMKYQ